MTNAIDKQSALSEAQVFIFKLHDAFNVVYLTLLVFMTCTYLIRSTDWTLLGTPMLGASESERSLFSVIWRSFMAYLAVDTVWILLYPHITTASSLTVLVHHAVTILYVFVPKCIPQFEWHMGVALLVEINTVLLTARRNVPNESTAYRILDTSFLLSWVSLRLGLYPVFTVFLANEWLRYSDIAGSYVNLVGMGLLIQSLLTILGFHWSIDLFKKIRARSATDNKVR